MANSSEFNSMSFNFGFTKINKKYHRQNYGKILTVSFLQSIFPIGPIYLTDHVHKCFPSIEQQFIDLAIIPSNKVPNI